MRLTIQEQVALLYTSQGSQRGVAALLGISHQKVGRILKAGYPELGGYAANSRVLSSPALIETVAAGLSVHIDLCRRIARKHGLPFNSKLPLLAARMPLRTGELGDRVVVFNTHWISDRVRDAWLTAMQRSGKFISVSVRSVVDLRAYNRQADQRFKESRKRFRSEQQSENKRSIKNKIDEGQFKSAIFTPYTDMRPGIYIEDTIARITEALQKRHEPATGSAGTSLADQYLLQVAPNGNQAKQRKARKRKG